ncbi:MAG: peptide ABC transporter substrate-binding protein [Chloroflexi bacterium]|nr:peptide ABC transporter substrate-binding protein [Chloroflexota bacterium]
MGKKYLVLLLVLLLVGAVVPVSAQGKSVTVSWTQEPDNLTPMYTTMTFAGYTNGLLFATAWDYDENYNPVPVLLTEVPSPENGGISEDGTTFTFRLKEGMLWSDGDPLDSADFKFTYDMYMSDQNTPLTRAPFDQFASVEAPDPTTFIIKFDQPYAPWVGTLNYKVLPEHILRPIFEEVGTLDGAEFHRQPTVSSGPYVLAEYSPGSFMRFTANPNFVLGVPKIETLVVTFIPDDQAYVASLLAGDTDLATFFPASEVQALRDAGVDVRLIASGYNEGLFFNVSPERGHPALQDVNVRKAIAMAFDRFSISEDLNYGVLPPGSSFWEQTPYENPDLEPVPFDLEQAAALLDEAGWTDSDGDGIRDKDGVKLELRFAATTRQIRQDMQALAQQWFGEIGVGVIIQNYESNVFFNGYAEGGPVATGDYDIATWSSNPNFPDPDTVRFQCDQVPSDENPAGDNWNYFCDPELDKLFEQQRVTTDYNQRVEIFHQIDQMLYDQYVWVNTWYDADLWGVGPKLQNVRLNGITPFFDVVNWDVSE